MQMPKNEDEMTCIHSLSLWIKKEAILQPEICRDYCTYDPLLFSVAQGIF